MISFDALFSSWNCFFHGPQSLFPLAIFRICFGMLVCMNALFLLRHVPRHLSPNSIFPLHQYKKLIGRRRFNLLNLLPERLSSVYFVLILMIVSGVFVSIGLQTNLSAFCCFVALVSINHRNTAIFHSGDAVLRIMAFLLIFSPAGMGWSIDAYWRGDWQAVGDPWCLRLMQLQVSILYLRTVFWKLRGRKWLDGTAAWYASKSRQIRRFKLPMLLTKSWAIRTATWGTLAIETGLGTLIWIEELRLPMMAAGILLHVGLEYVLNLQLFGWIMITCLLLFM